MTNNQFPAKNVRARLMHKDAVRRTRSASFDLGDSKDALWMLSMNYIDRPGVCVYKIEIIIYSDKHNTTITSIGPVVAVLLTTSSFFAHKKLDLTVAWR